MDEGARLLSECGVNSLTVGSNPTLSANIQFLCFWIIVYHYNRKNNRKFKKLQLVEKLRCILSLPNLFPSLARRFPFHFAPFGLTALAKATLKGLGLDGLTEQSAKL